MIIVSYDISNNKKRNSFSKYLLKFGYRLQYSVIAIDNSDRLLNVVKNDIENKFSKTFDESDSVIKFKLSQTCEIIKYGYAQNDNDDLLIVT